MSSDNAKLAAELRPVLTRLYLSLRRHTPITEYTAAQASALATLVDHGPMRMGELAERESIRMPTATSLVDGLIRSELVTRCADPTDRRAVVIDLTARGHEVLRRVRAQRDDAVSEALSGLSDDHRAALANATQALKELHKMVEEL
ncbi:putative MarR family transcriptional regulator [Gordonia effusa NBRC 100432]|uniref:Putative MarR family transcriptional regulator n=1 Tax=Gordonia effusa NBRC 100432 TaxID=1077974 RepID=H0R3M2_9ACTN|nr:MarR family transcriptional regulator [Gordonia effusa]GAB19673.1 putative MarR family transcriptional regulator [Gordonia effusa NBRC 100432]